MDNLWDFIQGKTLILHPFDLHKRREYTVRLESEPSTSEET